MTKSLHEKHGLTQAQAAARLAQDGYNELPRADRRTALRILLEVLREPMLALLIAGGFIYTLLGDLPEAVILIALACMTVTITVLQESRTERVLEALRDLTSPRALVIRDGQHQRIAGRDVVRDDIILLAEGDRVPADAKLLQAHDFQLDESLLTGESVPVPRKTGDAARAGTLVVRGTATAHVFAIGATSEIGKIGHSLKDITSEPPRLQRQTRALVRLFAVLGGGTAVLAVLLYGSLRGEWLDGILAGIALGMAMLPEEFPVVLTVFMAMGAWRISSVRVLTRRSAAIETLGSATVLCTDKTGTLTENRMAIAGYSGVDFQPLPMPSPAAAQLAQLGRMSSATDPHDPMEQAFHVAATAPIGQLVHSYGLRPDLLAMTNIWKNGTKTSAAAKGAPEAIGSLCGFNDAQMKQLKAAVDAMAADGLRVLGIASAQPGPGDYPASQRDLAFSFEGLVGLADPLRANVPAAMRDAANAGIRVIMITGDYAETARAIAHQAGLAADEVLTGSELNEIDDAALRDAVKTVTVFARIRPEQKLRIITALKSNGEVVAMTGDGVNDAPSLKAAHIGIAMGGRGTDVAREASDIVLLDDDFSSIVAAIRLGRRIYDNLRKATGFIFAVHVPIAGLALLPLLFGLPILFGPIHIAFLEMVIDPVCSLVFEAEEDEDDIMSRPPRPPEQPLFSGWLIGWSIGQGSVAFGMVAAIYLAGLIIGTEMDALRGLTFLALVLSILALILTNRTFSSRLSTALGRQNRTLWIVVAIVLAVLMAVLLVPIISELFRFATIGPVGLAIALLAAAMVFFLLEGSKSLLGSRLRR